MSTGTIDDKWHDLARQFDAGTTDTTSPPMSWEDAKGMRWAFYRWRAEMADAEKRATAPMYRNIYRVVCSPRLDESTGKWVVRFMLPEVSPAYRALDAMLGATNRQQGEEEGDE